MTSPMPLEESFKDWCDDALNFLERVAIDGEPFDAYTLEKGGLRQPPNPSSHWGRLFGMAADKGLIEVHSFHRSARPASKGSLRPLWRGLPNNMRKATA